MYNPLCHLIAFAAAMNLRLKGNTSQGTKAFFPAIREMFYVDESKQHEGK
jgi:hypothetical protein